MRAPVSVIIPTLNAQAHLPGAAAALMEGLEAGIVAELVVSDGGSEDATRDVAETLGARVVTGPAGRGGQLRRGVAMAAAPWCLLLHADTQLAQGWSGAVRAHIEATEARAAVFQLAFNAQSFPARQTAAWANLRTRLLGLPFGDQGMLVHRRLLEKVGGVPDLPLMEDVALARALKGQIDLLPAVAVTDARKYVQNGWVRQGARNLWFLTRYLCGADPARLARAYRR